MGIVPDKALFESWAFFPKRSVTDKNGPGEDYLVKQYLQLHGAGKGKSWGVARSTANRALRVRRTTPFPVR